jgi:hypothetical protein
MKKQIVFLILVVAILGVLWGVISSEVDDRSREIFSEEIRDLSVDDMDSSRDDSVSENTCVEAGGTWNACGSACRTQPEVACIELCVAYCECEIDDQCPTGYFCGDVVEGVGVCL